MISKLDFISYDRKSLLTSAAGNDLQDRLESVGDWLVITFSLSLTNTPHSLDSWFSSPCVRRKGIPDTTAGNELAENGVFVGDKAKFISELHLTLSKCPFKH